jgi:hypothetical protein
LRLEWLRILPTVYFGPDNVFCSWSMHISSNLKATVKKISGMALLIEKK